MQRVFSRFAKNDYAKYPFLKEAANYLKIPDLRIEDIATPQLEEILRRAEERVEEAVLYTRVSRKAEKADNEISSYPIAIVLATATKSSFIQKRYALAEAKQTFEDLKNEPREKILFFAQNFEWRVADNNDTELPYEFSLHFTHYLRNITHLREKKWKLVNRLLSNGHVYLTRGETARLLSEEVRKQIEKRFEMVELPHFPQKIIEKAERIKRLYAEKIGTTETEGFPKTIEETTFPPCIGALYQAMSAGRHLSHIGRFTLTSFLVNIGMSPENVVELFRRFSDYNERMTRYQVEHIAGEKGSRTRYAPPKCDTLETHGVCINPDEICQKVRHPLGYYKRKLRQ